MYCTVDDILLRYAAQTIIDYTQDDNKSQDINIPRLETAIADSCAIIDSKLFLRYPIPLNPVPQIIIRVAVDLTVYFLYKLRYDSTVSEGIEGVYKNAIKFLDDVKNGEEYLNLEGISSFENAVLVSNAKYDTSFDIKELAKL